MSSETVNTLEIVNAIEDLKRELRRSHGDLNRAIGNHRGYEARRLHAKQAEIRGKLSVLREELVKSGYPPASVP